MTEEDNKTEQFLQARWKEIRREGISVTRMLGWGLVAIILTGVAVFCVLAGIN